jgi:hypothetical protein
MSVICVLVTDRGGRVHGMGTRKTLAEAVCLLRSFERLNRLPMYAEGGLHSYRLELVPGDGSIPDRLLPPWQRKLIAEGMG